jgi:hypothetical protein
VPTFEHQSVPAKSSNVESQTPQAKSILIFINMPVLVGTRWYHRVLYGTMGCYMVPWGAIWYHGVPDGTIAVLNGTMGYWMVPWGYLMALGGTRWYLQIGRAVVRTFHSIAIFQFHE